MIGHAKNLCGYSMVRRNFKEIPKFLEPKNVHRHKNIKITLKKMMFK